MCMFLIRDIYFVYHSYKKVTNRYFLIHFVSEFLEKWDRKGGQGKFSTSIKVKVVKEPTALAGPCFLQEQGEGLIS